MMEFTAKCPTFSALKTETHPTLSCTKLEQQPLIQDPKHLVLQQHLVSLEMEEKPRLDAMILEIKGKLQQAEYQFADLTQEKHGADQSRQTNPVRIDNHKPTTPKNRQRHPSQRNADPAKQGGRKPDRAKQGGRKPDKTQSRRKKRYSKQTYRKEVATNLETVRKREQYDETLCI